MSRQRPRWWPYVRGVIRRYPALCAGTAEGVHARERRSVRRAMDRTLRIDTGAERLALVRLAFWGPRCTLEAAARALYISSSTARRWNAEFIRTVAAELGLLDEAEARRGIPVHRRAALPAPSGTCGSVPDSAPPREAEFFEPKITEFCNEKKGAEALR